jgi:hypothetical protein
MRELVLEIVTPAPRGSRTGNRVTALRWAKRLRELGHRVRVTEQLGAEAPDCLVALHAVKSAPSVARCRERSPRTPIIVALTGTDLYGSLLGSESARSALAGASRLVALQPLAVDVLPASLRAKTRVIYQSAAPA